mgnify:CR=1 FL=1|tara:strand:+ start:4823 stop:5560 length:738 start_codon:yes stop_codon:yes gene_type:complete
MSFIKFGTYTGWLLVVAGLYPLIHGLYVYSTSTVDEFGLNELGDYIGGVTGAAWSLAGVIFVYVTFRSQQNQLDIQEKEINNSISRIDKKDFESLLYKMLELHNNRIHNFDVNELKGVDCFRKFWEKIQYYYTDSSCSTEIDKIEDALVQAEYYFSDDIPLYLNSLIGILDHIKDGPNELDFEKYYKLLYHQLSLFEILIVYLYSKNHLEYKCLFSEKNMKKVKHLIKKEAKEIKIITLKELIED